MDVHGYADKGWYVFPLSPGTKKPYEGFPWRDQSTDDPLQIAAWIARYPKCNWAVDCGKSGLTVVDIDPGADPNLAFPKTFEVKTPRGGKHLYYKGLGRNSQSRLSPHVDTRGQGGYVLIPGSQVNGRLYEVVDFSDPGPMPPELSDFIWRPREAILNPLTPLCQDLDMPMNIERAVTYLVYEAPPAVEGLGGDESTLKVAMRVKDFGISPAKTLELLLHNWNDVKAFPPWSPTELNAKVLNAFKYGASPPGVATADAMFDVHEEVPASVLAGLQRASRIIPGKIPRRKWVLEDRYLARRVTLTIAAGGLGKSTLAMTEAVAVATGRELTGKKVLRPGGVLVINLEDPGEELQLQITAIRNHFNIPGTELSNLFFKSAYGEAFRLLVQQDGGRLVENSALIDSLIATVRHHRIELVIIDPLVKLHSLNENDNAAMDRLMVALNTIAEQGNCAISLIHHTRKPASGQVESNGNMGSARGASSLVFAARICHTLGTMSKKAAKVYGVDESLRKWHVRLDSAKANLSPPATQENWFRRRSVVVDNGDAVGILEPLELTPRVRHSADIYVVPLFEVMLASGRETLSMHQVATRLLAVGVTGANGGVSKTSISRAVTDLFMLCGGDLFSPNFRGVCLRLLKSGRVGLLRRNEDEPMAEKGVKEEEADIQSTGEAGRGSPLDGELLGAGDDDPKQKERGEDRESAEDQGGSSPLENAETGGL